MHLGGRRQWLQNVESLADYLSEFHLIGANRARSRVEPENIQVAVDQRQKPARLSKYGFWRARTGWRSRMLHHEIRETLDRNQGRAQLMRDESQNFGSGPVPLHARLQAG